MKEHTELETNLDQGGLKTHLSHRSFQDHALRSHHFKKKKMKRIADAYEDRILLHTHTQEAILEPKVSLYPEFNAYTFHLEGCPRKLLLYIIFYEADRDSLRFKYNAHMRARFVEYCNLFGKKYTDSAIVQGFKELVRFNTILSFDDRGDYMLNPMLAGNSVEARRRERINQYCQKLIEKGWDTSADFYPVYRIS